LSYWSDHYDSAFADQFSERILQPNFIRIQIARASP
jgi:hypothetical protein